MFSPYKIFFDSPPNYSKLKVFCCLCYSWLRLYTSHKLKPRSKPCIFFWYSLTQSVYLCYDPSTLKNFVSRHVKFIESIFPFKSTLTQAQRPESSTVSTYLPPIIKLSTVTPTLIPPSVGGPHQQLLNEAPTVTHVTTPDSETSPLNRTITQNQTPQISTTNNLPTATQ